MPTAGLPWAPAGPVILQPDESELGAAAATSGPGMGPAGWQQWWRYNGDPFLDLRSAIARLSVSTGGAATDARARAGWRPTERDVTEVVVPALQAMLQEGGSTELVRGALIALGRIGERERGGLTLDFAARYHVGGHHQPSTEAALVALGLRASPASASLLLHLFEDTPEGRELRDLGGPVDSRTRVYAAYALGLVARRSADAELLDRIGGALTRVLVTDERATFELHVATMIAMGMAPMIECDGTIPVDLDALEDDGAHVCRGTQIVALLDYFDDAERPTELRSHAAVPMARLAIGADGTYKDAIAASLMEALDSRSKEPQAVRQSAIIALGILGDNDRDDTDRAIRSRLMRIADRGDELGQRFALMSLAKIGARNGTPGVDAGLGEVQDFLLRKLSKGRGNVTGWSALALGVLGHHRSLQHEAVPDDVRRALRLSVAQTRSDDKAAACAIGIGVLRDYEAREAVLTRLESTDDADVTSYAALALGMVGATEARGALRELVERDDATPMMLASASIALRLLGDERAAGELAELLEELEETPERIAVVTALGVLGDSASVPVLVDVMKDQDEDGALRGAAAMSLGVLCDDRTAAWTADISSDLNYNVLTWTLEDPFGDGMGVLDMR